MNYKAEAEKIVNIFMPYSGIGDAYNFRAKQCAIKHVEGIIDVLRLLDGKHVIEIEYKHILILNQLKQM